jgi:hypothetical protein
VFFRREGAIMKFWSLDDVTDGNMKYCETVMNLETKTVEMTFLPFLNFFPKNPPGGGVFPKFNEFK